MNFLMPNFSNNFPMNVFESDVPLWGVISSNTFCLFCFYGLRNMVCLLCAVELFEHNPLLEIDNLIVMKNASFRDTSADCNSVLTW